MKLQRTKLVSIGTIWSDVHPSEVEHYIQLAADHYGHTTDQIMDGLRRGCEINTGPEWDATRIRDYNTTKTTDLSQAQLDSIQFDAEIEADQEDK